MAVSCQVVNIVTCDSEVGSGTLDAAGGRYFSEVVPLPQSETATKDKLMSTPVEGLAASVECVAIPARCKTSSSIVDSSDPVQNIVDRCAREEAVPIVHCVHGSKTGIVEPFPDTNFGKMIATRDAFIVVDACQGRFTTSWLQSFLQKGAMVLITGSKFFRGAPFSGAVLIPGELAERLARTEVDMPEGLAKFITANEVPPVLQNWRDALPKQNNVGLALRWVQALAEMEPTLTLSEADREAACETWRQHVMAIVEKNSEQLEVFDGGDGSTSIVSIRLKKAGGGYLKTAEAKKVFEWMTQDLSGRLVSPAAAARCYIGQPVAITKEDCVVRSALGSDSLREVLQHPERALASDSLIIQKLALLTDKYDELSASK